MRTIVLAGGSGKLGKVIARSFLDLGDQVIILSRGNVSSDHPNLNYVKWNGKDLGDWTNSLNTADFLINLSGASINRRFNAKNRQILTESRVYPTKVLGAAIQQLDQPPKLWINFSGISLFGGIDGVHDEYSAQSGEDFLANLSKVWEETFVSTDTPHTNKTILRLSPVLQADNGMFPELYPLTKWGLAGHVGSGKQMVSWIHETDLIRIIHWLVDHDNESGVYHAASPNPVENRIFMKTLRDAAGANFGLPLPILLAKLGAFLKGVDDSLLLQSISVRSVKLQKEGFNFEFPTIEEALIDLVKKNK